MAVFKCKMCGGALDIVEGATIAECESCGTKQTIPNLSDEKRRNLYDRANHFRRNNDYDKALFIYEQILNEDKTDAEAYWSIVLCKYGIEYVEDPSTHKRVPTINRTQFTSIFADEDYKSAIAYADGYQRDLYETEAKEIDKIQKGILAVSSKEAPFDVFICYKETDKNGRRTQDSVLAQELYYALKNEGLNVFFSRITLEDKLGTAYEPYIFAALNSAQVMVVLGTKLEYFNAVWVKNEWSRYLSLIKKGEKKTLIPAYKDIDPYDLPEEFSHLQAQDMSKLGFMQDLIRGIKKIIGFSKPSKQETVIVKESHDIAPLIRRAFLFLEDGDFASADEYAEKVLDLNPECAEAYVLKLLAELELTALEELENYYAPVTNNANYIKACRFADSKYRATLEGYNAHILERLDTERKEKIYREGLNLLNAKCYDDAIARFSKLLDYKDSADKIELCKQRKEIVRKEQVYVQALHRVSVANSKDKILNYEETIKRSITELQSISGYKDSDEQVAKLQAQLEKWRENKRIEAENARIRAEEERLRREREAELQRIKREKLKNQAKKVARIGIPSIIALAIILVLTFTLFIPTGKYNKANDLLNQGKYQEAFEIYDELDGFSGSEAKIATINAIKTIESGSYEKGIRAALSAGVKVQLTYGLNGGNIVEENNAVKDRSVSHPLSEITETEKQYIYTKLEDFSGFALSTRNGYDFVKWELSDCKAEVNKKDNAINLRLVAVWNAKEYTISYDLDGGNVNADNPIGYNPDDDMFALVNPTKKGYAFIGWTGTDLGDKTMEVVVHSGSYGDRTYTANWQVNTYVITYNPNEGILANTIQTVTFDKEEALAVPSRLGYEFVGWFEGTQAYTDGVWCADKNVELKAEWKIVNYEIKYNLDGGTTTNPLSYTILDNISISEPKKTGYSFDGWTFNGQDNPTKLVSISVGTVGEKEYTAHWTANAYEVNYNANNGTSSKTSDTAVYDSSFTLATAERKGYKFLGWFDGPQKVDSGDWKIANNVTLKAEWEIIKYKITYHLDGGTSTNVTTYTVLDSITLLEPTKVGYSFDGWTYDGQTDPTKLVSISIGTIGEKEYTAHWSANSYQVTYVGNGGNVSKETDTFIYDTDISLATVERKGYEFLGWYNGDDKVESGIWEIAEDTTLTAEWDIITYSISYNMNYGTTTNRTSYTVETATFSLVEPTKLACIFLGWTFDGQDSPTKDVTIEKGTIGNKTFTANWEDCLEYSLDTATGSYMVTGFAEDKFISDLHIPDMYNGVRVMGISMCAFQYSSMQSVIIPDSILEIGTQAFYGCESLQSVSFGSSVKKIHQAAFQGCDNLTSVAFSDSIEYIGSFAFWGCNLVGTITLPTSLVEIGKQAFAFNSELEKVYIPKSVKIVGDYAFDNSGEWIVSGRYGEINSSGLEIYIQTGTDKSNWSSKWSSYDTGYISGISLIYTW